MYEYICNIHTHIYKHKCFSFTPNFQMKKLRHKAETLLKRLCT